ncbi:MAG: GGDEF domain-containing protein [Nitrospirae bacterium]|nr:GGDEF domain-containing protein [Nitrospirota bacterium]
MKSRRVPLKTDWIQTLFKYSRDGFALADENKQIIAMNPAMKEIMGWQPSKIIGKFTCEAFFGCGEKKGCPFSEGGISGDDSGESGRKGHFHETSPLTKKGAPRNLWLSCSPLLDSTGKTSCTMIIVRDITRKKKAEEKLREMSIRDGLTGLFNHSFFIAQLAKEIHRSLRYLHPVSLLMIDIDDFKKYNDTYGHYEGDKLLRKIARILMFNIRNIDFAARYGGEEFAVILPETNRDKACSVAEKLRLDVLRKVAGGLTISLGVATCPEDSRDGRSLIKKADQFLYHAKKTGKNRVMTLLP